jgi:hypothetical protein
LLPGSLNLLAATLDIEEGDDEGSGSGTEGKVDVDCTPEVSG